LQAFAATGGDAEHATEGYLPAGTARRGHEVAARRQPVLADRGRWQVEPELRYLARNPGGEGSAVGSGPGAIAIGLRIPRNRRLDAFDELFDAGAAVLGEQAGPGIEPEEVGRSALGGGHHRTAAAQVPAEHVVNCVLLGSFALGGNPGVDS